MEVEELLLVRPRTEWRRVQEGKKILQTFFLKARRVQTFLVTLYVIYGAFCCWHWWPEVPSAPVTATTATRFSAEVFPPPPTHINFPI